KLFPDTNRARTVLDALLTEAGRLGIEIITGHRAVGIERNPNSFQLALDTGTQDARIVVLATGGLSLPKTGSDGTGYQLASAMGHSLTVRTPALVPLVLEGDFHTALS